jgi:hypothetical protein
MTVLRRATDQQQSEWSPLPEGLWRFVLGLPELTQSAKYGSWQVRFPLVLTESEQQRLTDEWGDPPEGTQQSWRTIYYVPLKLGYVKDGVYESTKLIDMLAAALGSNNGKRFREWIGSGGGPPRPEDRDDDRAELALIGEWLRWWEDLQVYGTIAHRPGANGNVWANFTTPMAVGSLPGQPDAEYQAHGLQKLRSIIAESHPELATPAVAPTQAQRPVQRRQTATADRPAERYTQGGVRVQERPEEPDDLPF